MVKIEVFNGFLKLPPQPPVHTRKFWRDAIHPRSSGQNYSVMGSSFSEITS